MGIIQTTPQQEIDAYLAQRIEAINRATIRTLCYVGEMCLNVARSTQSYKDQTGNLRSSLGYVVAVDGKIVQASDFAIVKDGADGAKCGGDYVRELISRYDKGIVLIVVAGMNYAKYVSAKGLDVLDSAELTAQQILPQMLRSLGIDADASLPLPI